MNLYDIACKVMKTKDYSVINLWTAKCYLSLVLMWPEMEFGVFQVISFIIIYQFLNLFVFYGIGFYLYTNIDDFNKFINGLYYGLILSLYIFQLLFIFLKSKEIKELIVGIRTNFLHNNIVEKEKLHYLHSSFKIASWFSIFLICAGVLFLTCFALIPALSSRKMTFLPVAYPFDWTSSPWREWMNFLLVYHTATAGVLTMAGVDMLIMGLLLSIVNQCYILKSCFLNLKTKNMPIYLERMKLSNRIQYRIKNADEGNDEKEYFVYCVHHHRVLLDYSNKNFHILGSIELLHLGTTVVCVGLGSLILTHKSNIGMVEKTSMVMVLIGFFGQLLIDCFFGTLLYDQANQLPAALLQSNWANIKSKELKKDLVFLIQNTQRTPQFSAYKLYELNMTTFVYVLRLAFSMYALFSSLQNK